MPELPDVEVYCEAIEQRVAGRELVRVRLRSPFLLRSVRPPLSEAEGRTVVSVRRVGKRIVFALEGELFLAIHLMIAGRFRWAGPSAKVPGRVGLAAFDFGYGTLLLTEAGSKRRAAMHLVAGEDGLAALDRGGLEVLLAGPDAFRERLKAENHTLKRALIDPRLFSGIGNAYSDEILHRACLSPMRWTTRLSDEQVDRAVPVRRGRVDGVDGSPQGAGRGSIPRESDRLPQGNGGPWPLPRTVPALRCAGPAHRLRRERVQLLRALPDRRPAARRPCPLAPAEEGLAEDGRGT